MRPFPLDALPGVLRDFVAETAAALGCDPAFVALPTLAATASTIGTTRVVALKSSWREPATVWAAVVARSGTLKSPAFDAAVAPLRRLESDAIAAHGAEHDAHGVALLHHERELAAWRRDKSGGDPPAKPEAPPRRRFIVADATVEALAPILEANPRGVLLARDELAGWLGGFDAYRNGRGADAAHWLEFHRGGTLAVDRKTGDKRTIHVRRAAVSVCGTIQPGTLARGLTAEHFDSGLAARLLLAQPPEIVRTWSDRTPARHVIAAYEGIVGELARLDFDADGEPGALPLAAGAQAPWVAWYNAHARRQAEAGDDARAAALAKIEAYAARFGLISALVADPAAREVSADALARGIALADWFAGESDRVYGLLAESDEARELRKLVEWVRRQGADGVTARDLMSANRAAYPTAEQADAALQGLADAGLGGWEHSPAGPTGGRPTRRFRVASPLPELPQDDADTKHTTPVSFGKNEVVCCVSATDGHGECEPSGTDDPPTMDYSTCPEANGAEPEYEDFA